MSPQQQHLRTPAKVFTAAYSGDDFSVSSSVSSSASGKTSTSGSGLTSGEMSVDSQNGYNNGSFEYGRHRSVNSGHRSVNSGQSGAFVNSPRYNH